MSDTVANPLKIETTISRSLIIRMVVVYLGYWLAIYYEAPLAIRLFLIVLLILNQLLSFYNATAFFLMALFVPFFADILNDVAQGLDPYRFLFFPFLFYALQQRKLRVFPFNNTLYLLILISLVLLQFSSAFQILVRHMPLTAENRLIDVLALVYDNIIKLAFLYFIFTRLGYEQLHSVLYLFMLLTVLESVSLLHMTYENRDLLTKISSESILWINPYFGHKNEWSMVFVFIVLIAIIKSFDARSPKWISYTVLVLVTSAIAVSLSRQAYVWTVLAFLLIAFFKRNSKIVGYMLLIFLVLILTKPDFLFERMESMVNSRSKEEFQQLNSKVGDMAIKQVIDNFTLAPQMFFKDWEYNYSEGFWNGFLHQQGILGLTLVVYIYFFIFNRFYFFYLHKNELLKSYGIFGMVSIILMFLANFNRRHTYFMHYKGEIGHIGLFIMFMILLSELTYYKLKYEQKKVMKVV